MFVDVREGRGRLLFRYDPELDLVEIKQDGTVYQVSLTAYRERSRAVVRDRAVTVPLDIAAQS